MMTEVEKFLEGCILKVVIETKDLKKHIAALLYQTGNFLIKIKGPMKLIKVFSLFYLFCNPCPNHSVSARNV